MMNRMICFLQYWFNDQRLIVTFYSAQIGYTQDQRIVMIKCRLLYQCDFYNANMAEIKFRREKVKLEGQKKIQAWV